LVGCWVVSTEVLIYSVTLALAHHSPSLPPGLGFRVKPVGYPLRRGWGDPQNHPQQQSSFSRIPYRTHPAPPTVRNKEPKCKKRQSVPALGGGEVFSSLLAFTLIFFSHTRAARRLWFFFAHTPFTPARAGAVILPLAHFVNHLTFRWDNV